MQYDFICIYLSAWPQVRFGVSRLFSRCACFRYAKDRSHIAGLAACIRHSIYHKSHIPRVVYEMAVVST
jgi:hypothetical protein